MVTVFTHRIFNIPANPPGRDLQSQFEFDSLLNVNVSIYIPGELARAEREKKKEGFSRRMLNKSKKFLGKIGK